MKKYIAFGKFEKSYSCYIIIFFILDLVETFNILIYSIQYLEESNFISFIGKTYRNGWLEIFFQNVGLSLYFIPDLIMQKYSHLESAKRNKLKKKKLTWQNYFHIFFNSFLFLTGEFCSLILIDFNEYITKDNFLGVLVLFIISIVIFKETYYRHHYFSFILIIILSLIRYIFDNNFIFNRWNVSIFITETIMTTCKSISYGYSKMFMDKFYFSPCKVCYLFGIINVIIILIAYIIFFIFNLNFLYFFQESIYINNSFGLFKLIFVLFISPITTLLINMIIQKYTICHIFLTYQIYCFLNSLREYLLLIKDETKKEIKNKLNIILITIIVCFMIEIFMSLIFLESIELKCCGLNKNLKKNIEQRAIEDINSPFEDKDKNILEIDYDYITYLDNEERLKEEIELQK